MPTIAAIGCDRSGPASAVQPSGAVRCSLECGVMLGVGRANIRRPHRVKVQREPVAVHNIAVARGCFYAILEAIRGPGQKGRVAGIQRGMNRWGLATPRTCRVYKWLWR